MAWVAHSVSVCHPEQAPPSASSPHLLEAGPATPALEVHDTRRVTQLIFDCCILQNESRISH